MSSASRRSSVSYRSAPQAPRARAASDCACEWCADHAGRRARRNAVVNHNRRAASDFRTFAVAQIALTPPLDFGEFGIANGFERSFINPNVLNDVLIAHHDRAAAVDNRTHC